MMNINLILLVCGCVLYSLCYQLQSHEFPFFKAGEEMTQTTALVFIINWSEDLCKSLLPGLAVQSENIPELVPGLSSPEGGKISDFFNCRRLSLWL